MGVIKASDTQFQKNQYWPIFKDWTHWKIPYWVIWT